MFFKAPNESDENKPMVKHTKVTTLAAFPREKLNSSWRYAVTTSCNDMVEVSAANANKT